MAAEQFNTFVAGLPVAAPLVGSELVPIVQSGETRQVAASNLGGGGGAAILVQSGAASKISDLPDLGYGHLEGSELVPICDIDTVNAKVTCQAIANLALGGATPIADGTYGPLASITVVNGIITAIS